MKIVICNAGYSGYAGACWRELASRDGVSLIVYTPETKYPYADSLLQGLNVNVLSDSELGDFSNIEGRIAEASPNVVIIPGWLYKSFNKLCCSPLLKDTKFVMSVDTAWSGSFRQLASKFLLRRLVQNLDGILVAGERGRQFASYIGFSKKQIFASTYGFDFKGFNAVAGKRSVVPLPKSFVYVGRYEPIKGLKTLLDAYKRYTDLVEQPWQLSCYGYGSLRHELGGAKGVRVHEFIEPEKLPDTLLKYGVYILPSLKEPWGVSLAEAAATGMPMICSDAVSSGIDLVRHLYNGLVFPAGSADGLLWSMLWCHENYEKLSLMGERAQVYAEAYSEESWADRFIWMCKELVNDSGR